MFEEDDLGELIIEFVTVYVSKCGITMLKGMRAVLA